MNYMDIIDTANELTINKFKIGTKIVYSFMVVDILLLIVGYIGIYQGSIDAFMDSRNVLILFMIFAVFSSILMCMGLSRSILKPLNDFEVAANRISRGDLTVEVKVSSRDELGQLAGYFREMTANLKNII